MEDDGEPLRHDEGESVASWFSDTFWRRICGFMEIWVLLFVLNFIFLVLLLFAFIFVDPESPSYPILLVDTGIVLLVLVFTAVVIRKCQSRDYDH